MGLAIYCRKDGASHKQYTNNADISLNGHDNVLFEKNLTNFRFEKEYGPGRIQYQLGHSLIGIWTKINAGL
jgi:hypothetical protein